MDFAAPKVMTCFGWGTYGPAELVILSYFSIKSIQLLGSRIWAKKRHQTPYLLDAVNISSADFPVEGIADIAVWWLGRMYVVFFLPGQEIVQLQTISAGATTNFK